MKISSKIMHVRISGKPTDWELNCKKTNKKNNKWKEKTRKGRIAVNKVVLLNRSGLML